MALSIAEEEYIIACVASPEAVWLHKFPVVIFDLEFEPTLIHCDNQICVRMLENPISHEKSKNIEIKCHYI
jgi:hypothetical protein